MAEQLEAEGLMSGAGASIDVTFELPASVAADMVAVVGDFNDWSVDESPMKRTDDGSFRLSLALPPGRAYRYRYLIDGTRWENDWQADNYLPNAYGGDDSVVDLSAGSPRLDSAEPAKAGDRSDDPTRALQVDEDGAVRSTPPDTEDGGTFVIEQQTVGPKNQVGGGEYQNARSRKGVDQAAEQGEIETAAPLPADGRRQARRSTG